MDTHAHNFAKTPRRTSLASPALPTVLAAAIASAACSDMTRDPLQPEAPSLARIAPTSTTVGFSDEFLTFDLTRWSKEDHPLGRGSFRIENVREGTGTVSLVLPARSYDGGEIRSIGQVGYGTYTARLQTPNAPGSITAFFLYEARFRSDEIDIEIYNDGTQRALLTTWVRGRRTANVALTLPFDPTGGLHDYTIDWTSSSIRFYADGKLLRELGGKVPRNAMYVMANTWWPTWLSGPKPSSDAAVVIDRIDVAPR